MPISISKAPTKPGGEAPKSGGDHGVLAALGPLLQELHTLNQALHVMVKPAIATITQEHKQTGVVVSEEASQEVLGHLVPKQPACEIGFEASQTINMGNFNSFRVGVSVKIPCEYKDLEDTYKLAEEWVNAKMEALSEQVNQSGG